MVNIHHHEPMAAVPDAGALDLFERQWTVYRKFVDGDYGSTKGAYAALHRLILDRIDRPFTFLDLACGDARGSVSALSGTKVAQYHGVDLAPPALEYAAANLDALACDVHLDHADYISAIEQRPEPADIVWIGLSLHHLETDGKRQLMSAIRRMIGHDGLFVTYEPTCINGEDRTGYLDRYEAIARERFDSYDEAELAALMTHVRSSDFPENMDSWRELGHDAGFAQTEHLYSGDPDLLRMFCFSG